MGDEEKREEIKEMIDKITDSTVIDRIYALIKTYIYKIKSNID